jgi:hypothetical protein
VDTDPLRPDEHDAGSSVGAAPTPVDRVPVRAPSTEALTRLEQELATLEAELAALESGDGSDA